MEIGLLKARAAVSESISETPTIEESSSTRLTLQRGAETADPWQRFPRLLQAVASPDFVSRVQRLFPDECSRIVATARAASQHQVKSLGGASVWLGERILWQRDPRTGKNWEEKGQHRNCTCRCSAGSDPRRVRLLSRCQHLVPLALVSHLESRSDYADEVELQIRSWIAQNPIGRGINWKSPAESAIRALNWLVAVQIIEQRQPRNLEFRELLLEHLTETGAYISTHLQAVCRGYNDYHYLANLVGMLYLGELRSDLKVGRQWLGFARKEIESEALQQFDNDGLLRHSSLGYHGFAVELICQALLLENRCKWSFNDEFKARCGKMLAQLERYLATDGIIAPWGDSEELRLYNWSDHDPRDFRNVLALGKRLLAGTQMSDAVTDIDEFLLLGARNRKAAVLDQSTSKRSYHLESSGLCRLCSVDWQVDFFADTQRTNPTATHQHNDLLSLTARFAGQEVLIDPGTFSYSDSESTRRGFRGTAAHNTVMLDHREQRRAVTRLPFVLRPDATARVVLWQPGESHDLVVAEHDGYCRFDDQVRHRRALCLMKDSKVLLIKDELRGSESHQVELNFQLGDLKLQPLDKRNLLLHLPAGGNLLFLLLSPELQVSIGGAWRSPLYDIREPIVRVTAAAKLQLPTTLICALAPCPDDDPIAAHSLIRDAAAEIDWL